MNDVFKKVKLILNLDRGVNGLVQNLKRTVLDRSDFCGPTRDGHIVLVPVLKLLNCTMLSQSDSCGPTRDGHRVLVPTLKIKVQLHHHPFQLSRLQKPNKLLWLNIILLLTYVSSFQYSVYLSFT